MSPPPHLVQLGEPGPVPEPPGCGVGDVGVLLYYGPACVVQHGRVIGLTMPPAGLSL